MGRPGDFLNLFQPRESTIRWVSEPCFSSRAVCLDLEVLDLCSGVSQYNSRGPSFAGTVSPTQPNDSAALGPKPVLAPGMWLQFGALRLKQFRNYFSLSLFFFEINFHCIVEYSWLTKLCSSFEYSNWNHLHKDVYVFFFGFITYSYIFFFSY